MANAFDIGNFGVSVFVPVLATSDREGRFCSDGLVLTIFLLII